LTHELAHIRRMRYGVKSECPASIIFAGLTSITLAGF
jgi:hypothetical protein